MMVRVIQYKLNEGWRLKFEKHLHRMTNRSDYNEALRCRGDLTIWFDVDAVEMWSVPCRKTRGGQPRYFELASEICLTLRVAFGLRLRQAQGARSFESQKTEVRIGTLMLNRMAALGRPKFKRVVT